MVRHRGDGLTVYCKAWRVRNTTGRYPKGQFTIDFGAGQLTCPAGVSIGFRPGTTVHFPKDTCAACPLRERCTASPSGRSVAIARAASPGRRAGPGSGPEETAPGG